MFLMLIVSKKKTSRILHPIIFARMTLSDTHMTTLLQRAIAMNNKAVGFMAMGQNSQGTLWLQSALEVMKDASSCSCSNDSIHKNTSPPVSKPPAHILMPCSIASLPRMQEQGYVYNHFFLLEDTDTNTDSDETMLALYSATILFNLGLALHIDGRMCGRDSSIEKAVIIYGMAYTLLTRFAIEADCQAFAAVTAVVLNNKAHICYERCDFKNATHYFLSLESILCSVNLHLCTVLSVAVVEELYLNTLVCQRPFASRAA